MHCWRYRWQTHAVAICEEKEKKLDEPWERKNLLTTFCQKRNPFLARPSTYVEHVDEVLLVIDPNMGQVDHLELVGLCRVGVNVHVRPTDHEPTIDPLVVTILRIQETSLLRAVIATCKKGHKVSIGKLRFESRLYSNMCH
jgi:hypothetical protein